jgi:hypothetical protein
VASVEADRHEDCADFSGSRNKFHITVAISIVVFASAHGGS